ncbi:MAG: CPBP family intramembrane metalloprotease [Chloroflexi bacterium]|nr:CPBP family intramembrane metalloprotease [Chloroflexota bacterium]
MQSGLTLSARSYALASHIWMRLKETPLLLGWLVTGLLLTLLLEGWMALGMGLVNLLLLGLYVLLIRWMTSGEPAQQPIKRPRLELAAALAIFVLVMVVQLLDFGVWTASPWQGWVRGFFAGLNQWVYTLNLADWAKPGFFSAVSSTIKQLLPTLLVIFLLGCGQHAVGLARPHWRLTAVLVGITAIFGLLIGVLLRAPLVQVVGLYGIGIFINALPEELFFRGLLLSRLEKFFSNPLNALVISALLFNAVHVPIEIRNGVPPLTAVLGIFCTDYPTGLLWGYLYLRTRSILPGMFWHAANGRLGFIFMDL